MKGKNPTTAEMKKLESIEKRMKALNKEIQSMGYDVYLACNSVNIMKGPSHTDGYSPTAIPDNSVFSFTLRGWDGGDW
jgi:hypothetical protein